MDYKAIQTGLGIFRHNQAYPRIIQAYSELCVTVVYPELWHIQNQKDVQNPGIF